MQLEYFENDLRILHWDMIIIISHLLLHLVVVLTKEIITRKTGKIQYMKIHDNHVFNIHWFLKQHVFYDILLASNIWQNLTFSQDSIYDSKHCIVEKQSLFIPHHPLHRQEVGNQWETKQKKTNTLKKNCFKYCRRSMWEQYKIMWTWILRGKSLSVNLVHFSKKNLRNWNLNKNLTRLSQMSVLTLGNYETINATPKFQSQKLWTLFQSSKSDAHMTVHFKKTRDK